ncbi:MAG: hypothetical protein R3312_08980 [Gammaproteobacteria bacterium]|nr:hypothetical protein [Gammaproteobacteria bacterium]
MTAFLFHFPASLYADEECTFNENAYFNFINAYSAENPNAKIESDGRTLIVKRDNEVIEVGGGGCHHLGVAIDVKTDQTYSEKEFLQKTLDLAIEFGDWLINTGKLRESIEKGNYQVISGIYFIEVDIMTVFEAVYDKKGTIEIGFYIN